MCECGRAGLRALLAYSVFIISALSPNGGLSRAILVSDFQDLCYFCSWFPKRPRARPEARRAWIAGQLLRRGRGSTAIVRPCGGEPSHVHARRCLPPRGFGEKKRPAIFPAGVGDHPLISLDLGQESGFGFRSIQLGFPSAWAWISFSPAWNSFRPAWNFFRTGFWPTPAPPFVPVQSEATASRTASGPGDRPA